MSYIPHIWQTGEIISEDKMNRLEDNVKFAISSVGHPNVAATKAAMTDPSLIYVYTGSESGMTAGNWYYYDGSAWVSGGVYNAVAI